MIKKNILFVCKYNRFRSKVAEAYFNSLNKNKEKGILLESQRWKETNIQTVSKILERWSRRNHPNTTNKNFFVRISTNFGGNFNWNSNYDTPKRMVARSNTFGGNAIDFDESFKFLAKI